MSPSTLEPALLVILPPDWEIDPPALADLAHRLAKAYGARLYLRASRAPMKVPLPLYCGLWPKGVTQYARWDVQPRVDRAFFNLDWVVLQGDEAV